MTLAIAAIAALASGCSGANGEAKVTLTIETPESFEEAGGTLADSVLGEIYAQALEGAGYRVVRKPTLVFSSAEAIHALEKGRISAYSDHLDTALTATLGRPSEQVIGGAQKAAQVVRSGFKKQGLTAFPPTSFSPGYVVGALEKTAKARGLKNIGDLRGQSQGLEISGPPSCHIRLSCVGGLETLYGLRFAGYIQAPTDGFKALETRFTELAMLPTTDGRLAAEKDKFAALEDNRHLLPAANVFLVTTPKIVREAGPEFEETIVAAQKGLTLPVIQRLDAKVESGPQTLEAVAAGYLKQIGLSG